MKTAVAIMLGDLMLGILGVLLILPHKPAEKIETTLILEQSLVVVEARWPDGEPADVDLWVLAPGDTPVGYSRLRGMYVSLLRDVLGNSPAEPNQEVARSWTSRDGQWMANVHFYRNNGATIPLPVTVRVWTRRTLSDQLVQLGETTVELNQQGDEITAVSWQMAYGEPLPRSINQNRMPLRAIKPQQPRGF